MRIEQIRLKNLNALAGEWALDLTHPAYQGEGIFAITGPTGAGKTTLLDALCLALYGRTPRLEKVAKSTNEVMSRQTGNCYAEVTFSTAAGRYRCHWSQRRARDQASGELQMQKHEIADANSGKILATKLREVGQRVETITGMDFDRFTRAMLLAQGGFAAFLQAPSDARAKILEQITGTAVYSQISKAVHLRWGEEQKKQARLQALVEGLSLLSPEAVADIQASLAEKQQQEGRQTKEIEQLQQTLQQRDKIDQLKAEIKALAATETTLQQQQIAFAPEQAKLTRALQALEPAAEAAALQTLRQEQGREQQQHSELQPQSPILLAELQQVEKTVVLAKSLHAEAKEQQATALPLIRQAQDLDVRLQEKAAQLKNQAEQLQAREQAQAKQQAQQAQDLATLAAQQQQHDSLQEQLASNQQDASLVTELSRLQLHAEQVQQLKQQLVKQAHAVTAATRQQQAAQAQGETCAQKMAQEKAELAQTEQALVTTIQQREETLGAQSLAEQHQRLTELTAHGFLLEKLEQTVLARCNGQQALQALAIRQRALSTEQAKLSETLAQLQATEVTQGREEELLATQLLLLHQMASLAEARQSLQDGEACPLCGATAHPFATGNLPQPAATQQQLDILRQDLKKTRDQVATLTVKQAERVKDQEQLKQAAETEARQVQAAAEVLAAGQKTLAPTASWPADAEQVVWEAFLQQCRQAHAEETRALTQLLEAVAVLEKTAKALETVLLTQQTQLKEVTQAAETACQQTARAVQSAEQAQQAFITLQAAFDESLAALALSLTAYGVTLKAADDLTAVIAQLEQRKTRWLSQKTEENTLTQAIERLSQQTKLRTEQLQQEKTLLQEDKAQQQARQQAQDDLAQTRQALFGHRDPEQETRALSLALERTAQGVEVTAQRFSKIQQQQQGIEHKLATLTAALVQRTNQLQEMSTAFEQNLERLGFQDEADFQAACLPEETRQALACQARQLADQQLAVTTQRQEKQALLAAEKAALVDNGAESEVSRESLVERLEQRIAAQKAEQQSMGELQARLKENARLQQQQQEQITAIMAQQQVCDDWSQLHALIGSADGKKYRNFAQGLTFEVMVGHANQQLQKMTDRYLLVRDKTQPLVLNVIDNHQAGEVRASKNLSGGESFIVSLALALGLSHMAGQNVRIDSLFLDEGFGTLDEDALETALESLASLQQDGKLIGVISHVPALKARISTQVQVIPGTGGRSRLVGAGCGGYFNK